MRAFSFLLATSLLSASASAKETVIVANGDATDQAILKGTWTPAEGALEGKGPDTIIESKVGVGAGDFEIRAVLTCDDPDPTRAALLVDDSGDFGLSSPSGGKVTGGRVYVRGFFFGDMTQDVGDLASVWKPGSDATMTIKRTGNNVDCLINGTSFWKVGYDSDRPFGKIGFRAGAKKIGVKSFTFEGNPEPTAGWIAPHDRTYPTLPGSVDVFKSGVDGYSAYRIPTLVKTKKGALVAICEGRKTSAADAGDVDLVVKRSTDGGATWGPQTLAYEEGGAETITIGNPCPVVDQSTGTIWLMFCRDTKRVFIGKSTDDGLTWEPRREITETVKPADTQGPTHSGPGHGFQTTSGRLCFPSYRGTAAGATAYIVYSDDHGATFLHGEDMKGDSGEPTAVQLSNGDLFMNARSGRRVWQRVTGISKDGGQTWVDVKKRPDLIEPTCEGSMIGSLGAGEAKTVLFADPDSYRRERVTVKLSNDDGATWTDKLRVYEGASAYSDLVQVDGKKMALLFERDGYKAITFSPFSLDDFSSRKLAAAPVSKK